MRVRECFEVPFLGRITGSASIDTLVRVGLEKQHGLKPDSRMVAQHDFLPCGQNELEICKGQDAYVLYRENEWAYVITEEGREGFVPNSFLIPYKTYQRHSTEVNTVSFKGLSADFNTGHIDFNKSDASKYVVLFDLCGIKDNDISVEQGEVVQVLNKEDKGRMWIRKSNNKEGFIPSSYCCLLKQDPSIKSKGKMSV
ncbi:SH3 domain-containing protein Dlish-like [Patella vulgata]|uniref:SH3 domain-containing protein Dlish-like n=1 Tax=Patella vulgata TaxID=6465 RepID=UPI0024A94D0F|nr:SH3 domain-containing protein Dlish-like [Patella vulgata]